VQIKCQAITDYTDRTTCPLFGDAAAAVLLEPSKDENGIIDHIFAVDGSGHKHLQLKAGGSLHPSSHDTVDRKEHFMYQEGQTVFKVAVSKMADVRLKSWKEIICTSEDLAWLVPHQANMRIIEATAKRMNLKPKKK
jgi:3-oxoacyl-[acyl-carrier-protein] synthase III